MNKIILISLALSLLMLILNHAKDKSMSELKIPEPSWKPGDEPMGYDLEGAMVTPYPSGAPEKWYGPPPLDTVADECVY